MTTMTKNTIAMTRDLERRGFTVAGLKVLTGDGRAWTIEAQASGCFRLFEIAGGKRKEHFAVEGDAWLAGDLIDYLDAVGARRAPKRNRTRP